MHESVAYIPGALRWLLCLVPVAALFAAIVLAKAKVPTAAGIGLAASIAAAATLGTASEGHLAEGALSGAVTALSILYAVWPAMMLYDIMREAGAFDVLARFARSLSRDMLALILLFGWAFSSFLQSITGFGVPVAVCAPLLVALGARPVPAVALVLIGHSWGNTYGTLAMAWDALVQMGPVENPQETALLASTLLWAVNLSGGLTMCAVYGGRRALFHGLPLVALLSAVMGGGQLLMCAIDAAIACFIPSTLSLIACLMLFKFGFYKKPWEISSRVMRTGDKADASSTTAPNICDTAWCASPFAFLAAISLLLFAVPGVREVVEFARIGEVAVIGHAGFALATTCLFAFFVMKRVGRLSAHGGTCALQCSISRLASVSAGIILLVVMARIMQTTDQMTVLAEGVAFATGRAFVPLSPALGTFGTFITSSNMSSNILLAGFQHAVADRLAIDPALLLAAQTAGGAAGAAIGPSTILMGAATVGIAGKEGAILKPLLAVSFAQAALIGIIVWATTLL